MNIQKPFLGMIFFHESFFKMYANTKGIKPYIHLHGNLLECGYYLVLRLLIGMNHPQTKLQCS